MLMIIERAMSIPKHANKGKRIKMGNKKGDEQLKEIGISYSCQAHV